MGPTGMKNDSNLKNLGRIFVQYSDNSSDKRG